MKLFLVSYEGLWLGGVAIVEANNEEEALKLVSSHHATVNFTSTTVKQLPENGVVYNDNGDY